MKTFDVTVHPSCERLPKEEQLAWALARVACEPVPVVPAVAQTIADRVIDSTAVAAAALNHGPVVAARAQAMGHPRDVGATVLGIGEKRRFSCEWAAWANSTAVRQLDMNDTFLAADYAHPSDSISPLLAVAQQMGLSGADLCRGVAAAYEVDVALVRSICLHAHKVDHIAHLCPAIAAGLGAMLTLPVEVVFQAINQAVHVAFSTRQSRKGEISSWKAYAPAHAGKLAIEAIDRAMRGETSPAPIYEGEDSVIAAMLDGPDASYHVVLPEPGEAKRAILDTFPKEHAAEYQAQAFIDLARRMRKRVDDLSGVERIVIHTSHHTHHVIGTGANDPQKFDPAAGRETLDHSLMYIFAVALQDGCWHHETSYSPARAARADTVKLWRCIETSEDPQWTRRYHDANERSFGGRAVIHLATGESVIDELAVADAHPRGAKPMGRSDYVHKLRTLAHGVASSDEFQRFVSAASALSEIPAGGLTQIHLEARPGCLSTHTARGIF